MKYLGTLFYYDPHRHSLSGEPFIVFLSTLLHKYGNNTRHDMTQLDQPTLV